MAMKKLIAVALTLLLCCTLFTAYAHDTMSTLAVSGSFIKQPGGNTLDIVSPGVLLKRKTSTRLRWYRSVTDTLGAWNSVYPHVPISGDEQRIVPSDASVDTDMAGCVPVPISGTFSVSVTVQWSLPIINNVKGYRNVKVKRVMFDNYDAPGVLLYEDQIPKRGMALPTDIAALQRFGFTDIFNAGDCIAVDVEHSQRDPQGGWLNVVTSVLIVQQ